MKFVLLVSSSPQSAATRRALRFAQAALEAGHCIERIFFYQDAVSLASTLAVYPQDELNLAQQWQAFIEQQQLDAVVCIAAALRRGIVDETEAQRYQLQASNLASGYTLSGLGQLHEAIQQAERVVHFKGQS